jgi:nucleoside-diphosphate-sugar epimerase
MHRSDRVLVTGASGYLGREVVRRLVARGYPVRALVRPLSQIEELEALGVEICFGDLRDPEAVGAAVTGVDVVVHLGAALRGTAEFMRATAVDGTANVADSAKTAGVRHVVYASSMAVYDFWALRRGDVLGPDSPLEPEPEKRGSASAAKCEAEAIALEHLSRGTPAWTILRPAVFFGNGRDSRTLAGFTRGRWLLCFGGPRRRLRLVHVGDVAAAILLAIEHTEAMGKVYTLSHPETVTLGEYVRRCIRPTGDPCVVYVPYVLTYGAMLAASALERITGRSLGINRRRLAYLYRDPLVDSSLIQRDLDWAPANGLLTELEMETAMAGSGLKPVAV